MLQAYKCYCSKEELEAMREEVASNENPSIYVRRADKLGGGPQVKQHCIHFGVIFLVHSLRMSLREDALGGGVI